MIAYKASRRHSPMKKTKSIKMTRKTLNFLKTRLPKEVIALSKLCEDVLSASGRSMKSTPKKADRSSQRTKAKHTTRQTKTTVKSARSRSSKRRARSKK